MLSALAAAFILGQTSTSQIVVVGDDWDMPRADVETLFRYVGGIFQEMTGKELPAMEVRHRANSVPITLYPIKPGKPREILINSGSNYWCQLAYQFSHEILHACVMSNDVPLGKGCHWFEESLAECSSIAVMTKMAEKWKKEPAFRGSAGYAVSIESYVANLRGKLKLDVLSKAKFRAWLAEHEPDVRANSTQREKNMGAAQNLDRILASNPNYWKSVPKLALMKLKGPETMEEYLNAWQGAGADRKLIAELKSWFVVKADIY